MLATGVTINAIEAFFKKNIHYKLQQLHGIGPQSAKFCASESELAALKSFLTASPFDFSFHFALSQQQQQQQQQQLQQHQQQQKQQEAQKVCMAEQN